MKNFRDYLFYHSRNSQSEKATIYKEFQKFKVVKKQNINPTDVTLVYPGSGYKLLPYAAELLKANHFEELPDEVLILEEYEANRLQTVSAFAGYSEYEALLTHVIDDTNGNKNLYYSGLILELEKMFLCKCDQRLRRFDERLSNAIKAHKKSDIKYSEETEIGLIKLYEFKHESYSFSVNDDYEVRKDVKSEFYHSIVDLCIRFSPKSIDTDTGKLDTSDTTFVYKPKEEHREFLKTFRLDYDKVIRFYLS